MSTVQTINGWVTLKRYCEMTGETRAAVHTRVASGNWVRGVQYSAPDGGAAWVNLAAVEEWLAGELGKAPAVEPPLTVEPLPAVADAPTHFTAYIPEVLQLTEDSPPLYANMTGMDMPIEGATGMILGPLTAEAKSARQFVYEADCVKWCEQNLDNTYFCAAVELPYV